MVIRQFNDHDREGVLVCLKEVWTIDSIEDLTLKNFLNNDNHLFVVEDSGKIIACATLHIQKKLIRNGGLAGFIEEVVVKTEKRGLGIGQKLIEKILEFSKKMNCYKVTLCCHPERISFYERCGFEKETTTMRVNL